MNIPKNSINANNVSFSGHNRTMDKLGNEVHKFYYLYDSGRYDCDVEIYRISKDKDLNIVLNEKVKEFPLQDENGRPNSSIEKMLNSKDGIDPSLGFAYRFRLTELDADGKRQEDKVSYAFDKGQTIGIFNKNAGNQYNVVLNNRAIINKNGPMQLIMPDEYYPGVERGIDGSLNIAVLLRDNVLKAVRTHANKLGGQLIGITKRLKDGFLRGEGISRIVGTPYTKDSISSHLYWTENAYQVSPTLGSEDDFKEMQVELFKNGINWIADAALVNEGFGGIHMSELLRNGDNSISKDMFRVDGKIKLGILPLDANDKGTTRMKIINAPFVLSDDGKTYSAKNPKYDKTKPTYIQFYDDRLVSEEQRKTTSPSRLSTYDKKNVDDNVYAITSHDDAVYPFPIEVSPGDLKANVEAVYKDKGAVDLSNVETITQVAKFPIFEVVDKSSAAGIECWDGNVEIAKLNFFTSKRDDARFYKLQPEERAEAIKDFERGTYAVREYAVNSGKYWTQLTSDTLLEYTSRYLAEQGNGEKSADDYMQIISNGAKERSIGGRNSSRVTSDLPPMAGDASLIDEDVIQETMNENYSLGRLYKTDMRSDINPDVSEGNDYTISDYIIKKAMDVPLETIPVATNLLSVLTSPYIQKKPYSEAEIGVSRFDTYMNGNETLPAKYRHVYNQAESLYTDKIVNAIENSVLSQIDGLADEDGMVSPYGRYVISEIMPDLVKYIMVRSLAPNVKIPANEQGVLDFSKVPYEDITIQSLGIAFDSNDLEEDAQKVVRTISNGIENLKKDGSFDFLRQTVEKRIQGRTLEDYMVAEMIIDKTESGLGWRIDAAKDVASIDAVRAEYDDIDAAWNNTINIWKLFNQSILKINPHAYTTAEITDLDALIGDKKHGIFTSDSDAERKFLQETGITSIANYTYLFSFIPDLFAKLGLEGFDDGNGWQADQEKNFNLLKKLDEGWGEERTAGMLFQTPDDGVVNSYNFVGNHDKPRILQFLALDKFLYESNFSSEEHKQIAESVVKPVLGENEQVQFDKIKSPAIAMGSRLNQALSAIISDNDLLKDMKYAVAQLATGEYKGNKFNAEAFGTRPIDVALETVLDQYEFNKKTTLANREVIKAKVLKSIMEPAFDRLYSIYKMMIALPGSPTDFAGDRVGVSGAETKAKNYHQQNRNIIPWELLNDPNYGFVKTCYDNMNQLASIRSNPALSALNNGESITMHAETIDKNGSVSREKAQGLIRYNDKSTVLCFFDNLGANSPLDELMDREGKKPHITGDDIANGNDKTKKAPGKTRISDDKNRVYLFASEENARRGLKHGIAPGTVFVREGTDTEYVVKKDEKGYYLIQKSGSGPVEFNNNDYNTLLFYKKTN